MATVPAFDLTDGEALALAQMCKRVPYAAIRELSADNFEADEMIEAVIKLRAALSAAGFSPR